MEAQDSLDLRRSDVNSLIHQGQRVVLPRLSDAVDCCLAIMASAQPGEECEGFVIDISDAFHCCPVAMSEWKSLA